MKYIFEVYDLFGIDLRTLYCPQNYFKTDIISNYCLDSNKNTHLTTDIDLGRGADSLIYSDYSPLNLPRKLVSLFKKMEYILQQIDSRLTVVVTKWYVFYTFKGYEDIYFVSCSPIKNSKMICVHPTGTPSDYADIEMIGYNEGRPFSMFYPIHGEEDLETFHEIIEIALNQLKKQKLLVFN